ncbi:MAG TPA: hypothetical protein VFI33_13065 [Puia sp.]|nr:hypothetical protein [Puia sp.]
MKVKKLIPLFLILVLSIQLLPLQRIVAWLSSGQVTEELVHGLDSSKSKSSSFEKDPALLIQYFHTGDPALLTAILNKFHSDETVLIRDADEILSPPPNI